MPVDLSGRRIFLASPGWLDETRAFVREVVDEFNRAHAIDRGVIFIVTGFEDLPAGLGRPQGRLNPHVRASDFLILLVDDRLGSPTSPTPPFRTGIEEELAVAAAACGDASSPMVDMLVVFRSPSDADLLDPSPGLRDVLAFRHSIEATKELAHHPYRDHDELRRRLNTQLREWARDLLPKVPVVYSRLIAALDRTHVESIAAPGPMSPGDLVDWAEAEAGMGHTTAARGAFARAVLAQQPEHLLRYARFLQRTGEIALAYEVDEQVLSLDGVVGSGDPVAVGLRTEAIANMALVKRRQGDLVGSRRQLVEAVSAAEAVAGVPARPLGYALDQLGLTETRLGDVDAARDAFSRAAAVREEAGDREGQAQSLVNLARLARQTGATADAVEQLDRALGLLGDGPDTRLLANVLASLALAVTGTDPGRARELLERSLAVNDRLGIPDGISVSSTGLASLDLDAGDPAAAMVHAQRALDASSRAANQEGAGIALRWIGQIHCSSGEWAGAVDALRQSVALAVDQRDPGREALARLWLARSLRGVGDLAAAADEASAGSAAAARSADAEAAADLEVLARELAAHSVG
jgi:tetratricopeptide (TPR) repeat protein